ncbi:hypothetical protein IWW55_000940 [Coemansia sp. RSA 2706]|nr:hypothetical protein LPJ63_003437 [Coemansia sp. RSA 2711]KAJ2307490.1 hypothetical protein IWW55_000940 [Coemansia sp. RSA 2706]KAJ2312811.1 hypothetical protein IWW54_001871 [Coemansia sp. RSA 2705]KAJ2367474.1 hypothetical protein H4S01_002145 [Coemansia sp. RSA 2610]KAJ2390714.1 hypothetical protein H4S02_001706 [Coemansia sp. RSA 2611]KAJ2739221.1 hypothetical protein H4R23_000621 [Coemansia sp. Cherry 401B]
MQLRRLLVIFTLSLFALFQFAVAEQESALAPASSELTRDEARVIAAQLSRQFVDRLYELRAFSEQRANQLRAKDDDDSGDSDDSTAKLVNKAAHALRPIVKEFSNVVNSALPAGPARQLVKATTDAVDSLMPLILKYALGI